MGDVDLCRDELSVALAAAHAAGDIIRGHYQAGTAAPTAKPDGTPVTQADLEANQAIVGALRAAFPGDGILAEETQDDLRRLTHERVWIVDPMDGTRDFVQRSGQFAVHIALAVRGEPAVAVVHSPIERLTYTAVAGHGACVDSQPIAVSRATDIARFRIGVSRFGVNDKLERFIARSKLGGSTVAIGASLKMMAVARGDLEISLCLTDFESEWDTCAPELIVREAGGRFTDLDGAPFVYNKPDVRHRRGILVSNGTRHDELLELVRPFYA
jgi:3'(2'), 5'-bisphosphate nucleotidase